MIWAHKPGRWVWICAGSAGKLLFETRPLENFLLNQQEAQDALEDAHNPPPHGTASTLDAQRLASVNSKKNCAANKSKVKAFPE